MFESDYRDIYKNEDHNEDTLRTHFKEKTLLFIGFSLTDPFVTDLFRKIKMIYNGYTFNEHFVFTTKSSEDFTEYDVTTIPINDWNESLLKYLTELEKIKLASNKANENLPTIIEKIKDEELTKDDVGNILELIEKKTKELKNDPSNRDVHIEVRNLQNKLNELLFKDINYLQKVDKPFRNTDLQTLFDTIYSSEKLDSQTLERIQKVRNDTEIYKWYDRSVILSAITCSLIHFNKVDEQKITLLIDFINDNEERVWQKSITSLFMVLNHLGNKWLRFNSIKEKVKSLNQNLKIQNACSTIIQLFNVGLNNVSMVNEELFSNKYFNDNPFNYFLPYHQEENPAFEIVYETYDGNDIEEFINVLNQVPIPDQLKYLLCCKTEEKQNTTEENKKSSAIFNKILRLNSRFYPYSIYVQEIISFYKHFPIYKHQEKLKSQLKLTETPLKDYLLNAKQKYSALGSHFMQDKNWTQAIVNFKEALKLEENNISDLLNLANCYYKNKDTKNELALRKSIHKKEPTNEDNLCGLFDLYYVREKDFSNSLNIANLLIDIDDLNADYLNFRGVAYKELKEYKKALKDYSKAIDINSGQAMFFNNRANVFNLLNNHELAILDWNKAIEIDPNNEDFYINRAVFFSDTNQYEKAILDLDKVIFINKKNTAYLIIRASCKLYLSLFDKALEDIKLADSLGCQKSIVYHSYSNYYRFTNDFNKSFEYIAKSENLEKDNRLIGTKATIYASMGDDDNFYKYLEEAFIEGAEANSLFPDIKEKYRNEVKFIKLLQKYKQVL